MFVDELLAAYPDAKVILTERDIESWMVSMNNTFYKLMDWKSLYYLAPLEPVSNIFPPRDHGVDFHLIEKHWAILESSESLSQYLDRRKYSRSPQTTAKLS